MKNFTHYISIVMLILLSSANTLLAQNQIPNADFESWAAGAPTDWDTSNENILGTNFVCVTQEMNSPYSGTSSAKVQSVTQNIFLVGPVTMPGILTLGDVIIDIMNATGTVEGGVPITGQPKYLKGYYKYQPLSGDSCIMGIGLTKWNGTSRDTIAYAYKSFGEVVTSWQEFNIPIEYVTWTTPDSMNIMFVSSNILFGAPVGGSTLWVDSLWLEYSQVAVHEIGYRKDVYLSESSDGNSLVVFSGNAIPSRIDIFSINGNIVQSVEAMGSNTTLINISNLPKGVYIARILLPGNRSQTIKFSRLY